MKKQNQKISIIYQLPFLLILAFVPLVSVIHEYNSGLQKYEWMTVNGLTDDFFLYYKSRLLIIFGALLLLCLTCREWGRVRALFADKKIWIPILGGGAFLLGSLISVFGAVSRSYAFWGGYEQWEGFVILLVYAVLFLYGYSCYEREEEFRFPYVAITAGALLVGLLGAFQAFGFDYVNTDIMHAIFKSMESAVKDIEFAASFEKGLAYSTLYNPNYVGSYASLLIPVLIGICIVGRKIWVKAMAGLAALSLLISAIASNSLAGVAGLASSLLIFLVFLIPAWKRHKKAGWAVAGGLVLAVLILVIGRPGPVQSIFDRLTSPIQMEQDHMIEGMELKDDVLTMTSVTGKKVRMKIVYEDMFLYQFDSEKYAPVSYQNMNDAVHTLSVNLTETENIRISEFDSSQSGVEVPMFQISDMQHQYYFVLYEGKIQYYNVYGRTAKLQKIDYAGFEGHMNFATGRGYIWSRTLPLLSKHILVGCGQDNFIFDYPNDDYVGKQNYGFGAEVITKPHNMYLQMWVQDGLFALLGFCVLVGFYIIDVFRTYFLRKRKDASLGIATFLGITGYLVVGFANDSTITVAPLFWGLLGLGYALNRNWRLKYKE